MNDILAIIICIIIGFLLGKVWKYFLAPLIITKSTQDIEENPKWITPKLRERYYGFSDVDIITARSSIGTALPRFRLKASKEKNKDRFQLLIPEDVSVNEIDDIAKIVLRGKLNLYYNLDYPDKSAHWLSILLYLLDGNDIFDTSNINKDKKPVDDFKKI